jgi:hypothetical protein
MFTTTAPFDSVSPNLPDASEAPRSDGADFDLVTWLVILEGKTD